MVNDIDIIQENAAAASQAEIVPPAAVVASSDDVLNPRKISSKKAQTVPPTIPVGDQFPDGEFPFGEIMQYRDE
jgi:hypothetical protein